MMVYIGGVKSLCGLHLKVALAFPNNQQFFPATSCGTSRSGETPAMMLLAALSCPVESCALRSPPGGPLFRPLPPWFAQHPSVIWLWRCCVRYLLVLASVSSFRCTLARPSDSS